MELVSFAFPVDAGWKTLPKPAATSRLRRSQRPLIQALDLL